MTHGTEVALKEAPSLVGRGVTVRVEGIRQDFGSFEALAGVNLEFGAGEFVTVLGPSGSGKTTLMRIIAGLVEPTAGRVLIDGKDVTRMPPAKREIGYVFQNYALFPHLSVFDNVAFPLRLRRYSKSEIARKVAESLRLVQMTGFERRFPGQLSGGQQQRVSLARAIVFGPALLLMDEPLGSLDKRLREELEIELRKLQQEVGITTMYVTHDQDEAFSMSDRIAVMDKGHIRQVGTPEEIYWAPVEEFVGRFVGDLNYFTGHVKHDDSSVSVLTCPSGLRLALPRQEVEEGRGIGAGIRPERIQINSERARGNSYRATVLVESFRGGSYWLRLRLDTGDVLSATIPGHGNRIETGESVWVSWDPTDMNVFEDRK